MSTCLASAGSNPCHNCNMGAGIARRSFVDTQELLARGGAKCSYSSHLSAFNFTAFLLKASSFHCHRFESLRNSIYNKNKAHSLGVCFVFIDVGAQGFEPCLNDPKSLVLPLTPRPVRNSIRKLITSLYYFFNSVNYPSYLLFSVI